MTRKPMGGVKGPALAAMVALAGFVLPFMSSSAVPTSGGPPSEAPPDAGTLAEEGSGGTFLPGSIVVLRSINEASTSSNWRLVRYSTTHRDCLDVRVYVADAQQGSAGGCGLPSPMPLWFAGYGGIVSLWGENAVAYGFAAGAVISILATLDDGTSLTDAPVAGWFLVVAPPGRSIVRVDGLSGSGAVVETSTMQDAPVA